MKLLLPAIFIFFTYSSSGQNTIGIPDIVNFSNSEYHGGTQTWSVSQAVNGVLFFANNEGLLSFDGNYWKLFPLPNKTIVRSLVIDSTNGRIYVGSQNEIGFFTAGNKGDLVYTSLKKLIPDSLKEFADIWHIEIYGTAVFFRANQKIFEYKNNSIRVFKAHSEWRFMKRVGTSLLAQDRDQGIVTFKNNAWQPLCNDPVLKEGLITGILDFNHDTLLVTTLKNGLYLLHGRQFIKKISDADAFFGKDRIYCAIRVNENEFAIGTTSGGCYIINRQGKLIQTISRTDGLQNNNILSLFLDQEKDLWMGLDNGIDFVAYNAPVKRIVSDKANELAAYAIKIIDKRLYTGTSDGLYSVPLDFSSPDLSFSKGSFTRITHTDGQVWNIEEINNQILLGHHEGTFIIQNNQAFPLIPRQGSWLFASAPSFLPDEVVVGTYNGIQLLRNENGHLVKSEKVAGINESLRFIAIESKNIIWASHPYRGVYRMQLSDDRKSLSYKLYTQKNGLPNDLNNFIFNIKSKVVVATQKGIYEYNPASDKFIPSGILPPAFRNQPIEYLKEDDDGNIWFESDKRVGIIDYHQSTTQAAYSILYFPELNNKLVKGFEYIYPYNRENIFMGSQKGLYHLNYRNYLLRSDKISVNISKARGIGNGDSLIYGGFFAENDTGKSNVLSGSGNSIHFEYSSPQFGQQKNIEYSCQLAGFEDQWSAWDKKKERDYTNLHHGKYVFRVKARTNLGNDSKPVFFYFTIAPAWYQTLWAYLLYVVCFFMLTYAFIKWLKFKFKSQRERYAKEQEHLRYMHQLEMNRNDQEIVKLQNENLEAEVNYKNKELANTTMHLVERGKVLLKIKEDLIRIQKTVPALALSKDFKQLINSINDSEKDDGYWDQFANRFDEVYSKYLTRLKAIYPVLTTTDLKLCAYLRVNLSSKEISQLMNISVRGVEIARYRLRKKLNVAPEENLFDFLINVQMPGNDISRQA